MTASKHATDMRPTLMGWLWLVFGFIATPAVVLALYLLAKNCLEFPYWQTECDSPIVLYVALVMLGFSIFIAASGWRLVIRKIWQPGVVWITSFCLLIGGVLSYFYFLGIFALIPISLAICSFAVLFAHRGGDIRRPRYTISTL